MKEGIFKYWTTIEVEKMLDSLSNKTGLDWRCMDLIIDPKMENTYGAFFYERDNDKNIVPKRIRLSKKILTGKVPENIVENIIIHEFMHFYSTVKENEPVGHSKIYKEYCKEFGFNKDIYASMISLDKYLGYDDYKYIIKCSHCDFIEGRYRISGSPKSIEYTCRCPKCNSKKLKVIERL